MANAETTAMCRSLRQSKKERERAAMTAYLASPEGIAEKAESDRVHKIRKDKALAIAERAVHNLKKHIDATAMKIENAEGNYLSKEFVDAYRAVVKFYDIRHEMIAQDEIRRQMNKLTDLDMTRVFISI